MSHFAVNLMCAMDSTWLLHSISCFCCFFILVAIDTMRRSHSLERANYAGFLLDTRHLLPQWAK